MSKPRPSIFRAALGALAAMSLTLLVAPADAVGTRSFRLANMEDFKGGNLTGVAVDSSGELRAGLNLGSVPINDASSAWSAVVLGDGSVLVGTGNDGKIFRVSGGQATVAATTDQMAASALAVAWNGDVIAGTFPEGKLYKIPAGQKGGAAAQFSSLPGAEHVWSLAFDAKNKALYAATGPEGKLYRIDQTGKAQVYYDSDETHLVSVAVADDGTVYTGSNGKALLYKVTGPGRASVLYDFDTDDVKSIAVDPSGRVYAIANRYSDTFAPPKRTRIGPPGPQPTRSSRPGRGYLYRFGKDGVAEPMMNDGDAHYTSLTLGDDGLVYVGSGAEGRLYAVDDNHLERIVADTAERQTAAVLMNGKNRFIVSSDPVVVHPVKGVGGADAVWTSKVLDAGLRAMFGRLSWRATGVVELSTRSGNTASPDSTWTAWSTPLNAPGQIKSDPGRYVQIRARWARDPAAVLREISLFFVTDNARAIVTSIEASNRNQPRSLRQGVQSSGGETPRPSSSVRVSWKVDNPDQDELRYRVSYRLDGQSTWRSAQKPGDKLTRTDFDWDTSSLPEGYYRLLVEASDELANPPDKVLTHKLESSTVLVDNTPPVFKALAMNGRRLTGEVVDGIGPVARIEVSIAGSDEWRPIAPKDGVYDEASEPFDADISALVPAGSHILAVRAYDTAGNMVSRDVEAK